MAQRENFGSGLTAMFAMAGSAIGLGNLWRFPYQTGQDGGAAFILIYLIFSLIISLPILLCESAIGRSSASGTFGAMDKLAPGTRWKWLGLLTVFTPMLLLSYYSVVGGWSVGFFAESLVKGFGADASSRFSVFTSHWWLPLVCHTLFIGTTALVVSAGVKSGIERFNKISLPLLFVLIVLIAVYSTSLPGSEEGVRYLLKPDFGKLSPRVFADAMGQSFFSLSLGVGTILTYSSYMKKETSLLRAGAGTAFFDLLFALIAGFAIMPAVFAAGIEPGAGPGLIFETLPFIFGSLGQAAPLLSRVISVLFFLTIAIAALTSSISMLEVQAAYLIEEKKFTRGKAVLLVALVTWALGVLCSLSGKAFSVFDYTVSNFLLPLGALLFVIFAGWKMPREMFRSEFIGEGSRKGSGRFFGAFLFMVRYVIPVAILIIFLTNFQ